MKANKKNSDPTKKSRAETKELTPSQKKKLEDFLKKRKKALYNKSKKQKAELGFKHSGGSNWIATKKKTKS